MKEHWEINHLPFDGDLTNDKVICKKCGWSWNYKDGGNDPYVCHSCGYDNILEYEYKSNFVDVAGLVKAGTQVVSSTASAVSSSKQAKASIESSKTDIQREVELSCGGKRRRSWSKKRKAEYDACANKVLDENKLLKNQTAEQLKNTQEFNQKLALEKLKDIKEEKQRNTYIVIGGLVLVLGVIVYLRTKK